MQGSASDAPSTPRPATGKLGIITPGLGAVATTFMAGVESIRRGHTQADRLAHADGDDPPRQAHRESLAAHQGLRSARRPERHRLRRLGSDRRRRLHRREEGRRARGPRPRADQGLPLGDQADAGRVREQVRHAHQRHERQEGKDQARPRRAAAPGHPRLQGEEQVRPRRHRLVRVDRDLHQARPQARHARAVRARDGEQRRGDRAVDALRVRGDHGGRAVLQRRARTSPSTSRRWCSSRTSAACRSPARTSRPGRPG